MHFSPEFASEAELWTNAGLHGNAFWTAEALRVPLGVRFHQGKIDHGNHYGRVPSWVLDGMHQIYVSNPWLQGIRPLGRRGLQQDVSFVKGPDRLQ